MQPLTERIIIVLDSFHEIEDDSSGLEFIDLLLRYAPKQLHFIITARKTPCLRQISRLRSQGQVLILTANDLAFTTAEIQALYELHSGANLSLTVAQHLKEHTFGWPLSIHLTLKSLGGGRKTLDADTTNQQLTEYIKSEILAQHPAQIQNFFRDISIFNTLTPSVVEEVLGYQDAPALFDYLKHHNLFLSNVNGQNELYVYPPQLQNLLQQNLAIECRSRYLQLHGRAARYFEAKSQLHEALEHYQQAEDWDATIHLLEGLTEEMLNGQHLGKLHKWLQCLTSESHLSNPKFLLYQASYRLELDNRTSRWPYSVRLVAYLARAIIPAMK